MGFVVDKTIRALSRLVAVLVTENYQKIKRKVNYERKDENKNL